MMRFTFFSLCFTAFALAAGEKQAVSKSVEQPEMGRSGLFLGLGGSYNSVKLDQHLSGDAVSSVFLEGTSTQVASGQAGGPIAPWHETLNTFAPETQIGYFGHFGSSPWLWGCEFFYKYLGLVFSSAEVVFQAGKFNTVTGVSDNFTGHAIARSMQVTVNNELSLMALFGRSFKKSYLYVGAGPVLYGTHTNIYSLTGYADINGNGGTDITGNPVTLFNSLWMWGGGGELGGTWFVSPRWFLDINYSYLVTGRNPIHDIVSFSNVTQTNPALSDAGKIFLSLSQRITTQALTVSVNFLW
ncbi:MAG: hypothetical protein KGI80_06125 [Verrucomicrobiota bacterium]|nr:hypothetical protein [Verrucomicrobiota bacterium]